MNAPWTAASLNTRETLAGREPLAAYISDDASLQTLRTCLAEMGWTTSGCHNGAPDDAVQALVSAASPAILVVDLSTSPVPLEDIQALAQVCEPGTQVIAIGQTNDVQFYRALLASGIHDYLLKPLTVAQLDEAIVSAQAVLCAPRPAEMIATGAKHNAIAVIGTRGGVGATMVATSLAWVSSTHLGQPTALFDLDIQFGTGGLSLDLDPGLGLVDAIKNPARIDGLFIERAVVAASPTLSVLCAEAPIAAPMFTDGAALLQLSEELRHAFAATVVDLPRTLLGTVPQLLAEVTTVVLTTELTLAGARDTIRILDWLKFHGPHAHIMLIANKVPSGICEIGPSDFEAAVERRIDFLLPCEPRVAIASAKQGQSFAQVNQGGRIGEALVDIAQQIWAAEDGEDAARIPRLQPSLLARLNPLRLLRGGYAPSGAARAKTGA